MECKLIQEDQEKLGSINTPTFIWRTWTPESPYHRASPPEPSSYLMCPGWGGILFVLICLLEKLGRMRLIFDGSSLRLLIILDRDAWEESEATQTNLSMYLIGLHQDSSSCWCSVCEFKTRELDSLNAHTFHPENIHAWSFIPSRTPSRTIFWKILFGGFTFAWNTGENETDLGGIESSHTFHPENMHARSFIPSRINSPEP